MNSLFNSLNSLSNSLHTDNSLIFELSGPIEPTPLLVRSLSSNYKNHSVLIELVELMPRNIGSNQLPSKDSHNCHHIAPPKIPHHPSFNPQCLYYQNLHLIRPNLHLLLLICLIEV